MGILELVGLVCSILVAVVPTLLAHLATKGKERTHDTQVLIDRDRTVLRDGLIKLRGQDKGI
jgi:hypothetical protein